MDAADMRPTACECLKFYKAHHPDCPVEMARRGLYHRKSAASPDWPYEHRCAECGEEWPCETIRKLRA